MAPTIQWRHQDQLCSFSTSDERRLGPLTLQLAALMNTEFVQAHPAAPICIQLFWLMHPALGRYGWPFNMHLCQVCIVPPMGRRASCRPPELLITWTHRICPSYLWSNQGLTGSTPSLQCCESCGVTPASLFRTPGPCLVFCAINTSLHLPPSTSHNLWVL